MMHGKSLAYFGLVRFCDHCQQEGTESNPATWSEHFGGRYHMDCYNDMCDAIDMQEMAEFTCTQQ